jgi:nucleotidyltransferase substrate binding protein (TIGR01987 family)
MNESALRQLSDSLNASLGRVGEALAVPADRPLAVDGTIQRVEFTFELFWKTVRRLLAQQGVETNSPKAVLQHAYRLGWLDDEQRWLKLLEDRDLTSHTYWEGLHPYTGKDYTLTGNHWSRDLPANPAHHAAMREAVEKLRAAS